MNYQNRTQAEQRLESAIAAVFSHYKTLLDSGRAGSGVESSIERDLIAALRSQLGETYVDAARQLAAAVGDVGFDDFGAAAAEWASGQAAALGRDLADSISTTLAIALTSGAALPEVTSGVFSRSRAGSIAITETTRAATRGMERMAKSLAIVGLTTATWHTAEDGDVCPLCEPLNDQPRRVWETDFPDGPPAHPRCRCYLIYGGVPA